MLIPRMAEVSGSRVGKDGKMEIVRGKLLANGVITTKKEMLVFVFPKTILYIDYPEGWKKGGKASD